MNPIANVALTPEWLAIAAGAVISLLFSYIPGLNVWYAGKSEQFKKLFMLGVLVVVTGVLIAAMCLNIITIQGAVCEKASLMTFLFSLALAVMSNQSVFGLSAKTTAVKVANLVSDKTDLSALKKEIAG